MRLNGSRVWLTGASSGIGEALAYALAGKGARLALSARRQAELERVRDGCEGSERPLIAPLDLTDEDSCRSAAESVLKRFGGVDVLVHNGGISQRSLAAETDLEVDRRLMETNFFGTVGLTKLVLPSMLERGSGQLVVVSSLVGKIGTPLRSGYAASKHALHGFFDSLRAETWSRGLRVTLICPGFIRTELPLRALTGDGSPQGRMDRAQLEGMPAEKCAARIVCAIEREEEEVLIGGKERFAVHLKRALPGLFNRVIRRARVT